MRTKTLSENQCKLIWKLKTMKVNSFTKDLLFVTKITISIIIINILRIIVSKYTCISIFISTFSEPYLCFINVELLLLFIFIAILYIVSFYIKIKQSHITMKRFPFSIISVPMIMVISAISPSMISIYILTYLEITEEFMSSGVPISVIVAIITMRFAGGLAAKVDANSANSRHGMQSEEK